MRVGNAEAEPISEPIGITTAAPASASFRHVTGSSVQ